MAGSDRAGLVDASLRKDGSFGIDRFGFQVTRQTAGLTFVGMQLGFVRLRYSALHLSFLLVRLGGFAADYFRGHPSTLRAAGLSKSRCGGFGQADTRLIPIGESTPAASSARCNASIVRSFNSSPRSNLATVSIEPWPPQQARECPNQAPHEPSDIDRNKKS